MILSLYAFYTVCGIDAIVRNYKKGYGLTLMILDLDLALTMWKWAYGLEYRRSM
jgi:hypothetical protein